VSRGTPRSGPPVPRARTPLGAELYGAGGPLGVVVVHEVFGRDDYVRTVAEALGQAGHVAAVVDLYDGSYGRTLEEAFALRGSLSEARVLAKLDDAGSALRAEPFGAGSVGVLGFCMGGGLALLGGCRRPFDFVVDYYGRIDQADDVATLGGPLLLVLASEDERVTPWALGELVPAVARAKKRLSVELFPGVRHAFHRPGWEGHAPAAAEAAWVRTLAFLAELSPGGPARAGRVK